MEDGCRHRLFKIHHFLVHSQKVVPNISKKHLHQCNIRLQDYQGNSIPVLGRGSFQVESSNFTSTLQLVIMDDTLPSLLGLDWFHALGLKVSGIHSTSSDDFTELTKEFADVFDGALGKYKVPFLSI